MTKPLTYKEFFEEFNTASFDYYAFRSTIAPAKIVDRETDEEAAHLCDNCWLFFGYPAFEGEELNLMARLAATSPELRGEHNNDQN